MRAATLCACLITLAMQHCLNMRHLAGGGQQHGSGAARAGPRVQQADGRRVGVRAAARQLATRQVVQPHLDADQKITLLMYFLQRPAAAQRQHI